MILQRVLEAPPEEPQTFTDRRLKPKKLSNWRRRYHDEVQLGTYPMNSTGGHIQCESSHDFRYRSLTNKLSVATPSDTSYEAFIGSNRESDLHYGNVPTTKSFHDLNEARENDSEETSFPGMAHNMSPFDWSRFEDLGLSELVPLFTALRLESIIHDQLSSSPNETEAEDSEYLLNSQLYDMSRNASVSGVDNIDLCLMLCSKSIEDSNHETLYNTPQYPWRDLDNVFLGAITSPLNEIYVFPPSQALPRTRKANIVDLWARLSTEASKLELKLVTLEEQFGNHNPAVIAVIEQLSSIYSRLENYGLAEQLKQRLADIYCQTFGSKNVRTLEAALCVIEILLAQGQLLKAKAVSDNLWSSISQLVEQDHPLAISAKYTYARIYRHFGRSEEAERCFRQHLQIMLSLHGPKALPTIKAMSSLSDELYRRGASKESEVLVRIAAQLVVELPPVDESPCRAYRTIINRLHHLGSHAENYQIANTLLDKFILPLGDQHPAIWKARVRLAWSMDEVGRQQESIELFRAIIAHQDETMGNIHKSYSNSWCGLANALLGCGQGNEAMMWYERAFKTRLELSGASNRLTINTAHLLGRCYDAQSRFVEALDLYNSMVHMLGESGDQENVIAIFKSYALYVESIIAGGTQGNV